MTEKKTKIGIIGLGMIGGSIALALRGTSDVYGYDTDAGTCAYAEEHGFCRIAEIADMKDFDVVFVCVPLAVMGEVLGGLSDKVGNAIITDVASVKMPYEKTRGRYVGGHPMAGTENGGIMSAKPHLFQNAYWIITGYGESAERVGEVVRSMGAIPITMSAEDHDRAVSVFSHVPHAVAYALTAAAIDASVSPIAGSGFLDTTRIAKSDEKFWTEVFSLNAKNVTDGIKSVVGELNAVREMIERGDRIGLCDYLGTTRQKRAALGKVDLGGEALYVDLVDRVGEFERITGAIARAGINLKNIALVPGREGANGALRLEFADQNDMIKAKAVLGEEETWQE
ncbi:MAG: prephenate dehydrogenase/arogenate dehydrogenase family protein [Clostridiales bacterium]|nr:prephenate dehydrogenase/arogenate dehydrogenase family protein [Clostridiales bacterium]